MAERERYRTKKGKKYRLAQTPEISSTPLPTSQTVFEDSRFAYLKPSQSTPSEITERVSDNWSIIRKIRNAYEDQGLEIPQAGVTSQLEDLLRKQGR